MQSTQQPVPFQQYLVPTNSRSPVELVQADPNSQLVKQEVVMKQEDSNIQQSIQQLLQNQIGKHQNILIKDPKTGQQHLVVQTSQAGGQQYLVLTAAAGITVTQRRSAASVHCSDDQRWSEATCASAANSNTTAAASGTNIIWNPAVTCSDFPT